MKISLAWLKELVDLPGVGDLVSRFNLSGLEVSSIRPLGTQLPAELATLVSEPMPVWAPDKVVFAKILRIEKHPDADRLKLPVVDDGTGTEKHLVTGAPNIAVGESGQTVILARTGSALFDGHSETKVIKELKPTKIRGIPSDSMLCSAYELGLSDEHEGIILYPEEIKPGTPAVSVLGDTVVEVDILPNMGRCLSMLGIAREVAALFGGKVRIPSAELTEDGSWPVPVEIAIEDTKLSERYSCRLIDGLKVGSSPSWMKTRLLASGMRPISNLVDVTNFVMLEQGQPLHAFDYDKLIDRAQGGSIRISVRAAKTGEKLLTLDGKERELDAGMLVIADAAGPIALAGIMGGAETEVTAQTTRVLLESAHFDPIRTRKTMQALHLPSEASLRFSRGVAATQAGPALERAAQLLAQYGEGKVAKGVVESWPVPAQKRVVPLTGAKVLQVLGMELPAELAEKHLSALCFGVNKVASSGPQGWELEVAIPPERLDIQEGAIDLIEELARLEGYDRLPMTLLAETTSRPAIKSSREFHESVKNALVELGMQEVITYSLTGIEQERLIEPGLDAEGASHIKLANPISPEKAVMRRSLAASVIAIAISNLRQNGAPVQKIFEIGKIYQPGEGQEGEVPAGPVESNRLAMVLGGRRREPSWDSGTSGDEAIDFFDLKGALEGVVDLLGLDPTQLRLDGAANRPGLHPGRQAQVAYKHHGKEKVLGWMGELHPKTAKAMGWEGKPLIAGEFDLDLLESIRPEKKKFKAVSRFPIALRDVAVVVDEAIAADQVAREIRAAAGDLLSELRLFDIYRGEGVPEGRKSLAWSLGYQAFDRTLADKEIDKAHLKVEDRLVRQLKAVIRGKEAALG